MFSKTIFVSGVLLIAPIILIILFIIWLGIRNEWKHANMNQQLRELPQLMLG